MECKLAGETEVLGENLPQRHCCPSQNPTWPDPGLNLGRRGGKPATNRLSYGAAIMTCVKTGCNLCCKTEILEENICHISWHSVTNSDHLSTFTSVLNAALLTISKKIKLSLCLTNWALSHECLWGSVCIDPHFLDLDTRWRWMVSFTFRLL
jgi:hypothetical protein